MLVGPEGLWDPFMDIRIESSARGPIEFSRIQRFGERFGIGMGVPIREWCH